MSSSDSNTIVISGMGGISPAGQDCAETRRNLYLPPLPPNRMYPALKMPFRLLIVPVPKGRNKSESLLGIALREALADAGLTSGEERMRRVGLCLGSSGDVQFNDLYFLNDFRNNAVRDETLLRNFTSGSIAEKCAKELGIGGPVATISNACVSSADAVSLAAMWIQSGKCDIALAGGVDRISKMPLTGFHALGVTSEGACRPFDRDRSGLNLGEGAGIVVLESVRSAAARGHKSPFFLAGFGAAGDAYHITAPHAEGRGLEKAVRMALSRAGIGPDDISFVNAHGTGTEANDLCEGTVLARIFGERLRYFSTKSITGHTLGAAGVLELIFTLIMLDEQRIPPNWNCAVPDPRLPVPPMLEASSIRGSFAMSTSLAFGGCNAALIAGRF